MINCRMRTAVQLRTQTNMELQDARILGKIKPSYEKKHITEIS